MRRDSQVAEVVDELAEVASAVAVGGDLAHREVGAAEGHALGVDPDEDLGDGLDVEIVGETDDADLGVLDRPELGEVGLEDLGVDIGVALQVLAREGQRRVGVEVLADVGDPLWVLPDDRGQSRELFGDRVERDDDPD